MTSTSEAIFEAAMQDITYYTHSKSFYFSLALLHVFVSGWDQFVQNVLRMEGELHQVRSILRKCIFCISLRNIKLFGGFRY